MTEVDSVRLLGIAPLNFINDVCQFSGKFQTCRYFQANYYLGALFYEDIRPSLILEEYDNYDRHRGILKLYPINF